MIDRWKRESVAVVHLVAAYVPPRRYKCCRMKKDLCIQLLTRKNVLHVEPVNVVAQFINAIENTDLPLSGYVVRNKNYEILNNSASGDSSAQLQTTR